MNRWPSPFQFFMLQHLLFVSCTLGQLLKAHGPFTNWSWRVVPLLFLATEIELLCSKICSYLTADYFLPGHCNFSLFFLEVIQNAAKPFPTSTLCHSWQTCIWISPPSLPEFSYLHLSLAQLNSNVKCVASMAYWLAYVQHFPFLLTSPILILHLPSWLPPATITATLECLCAFLLPQVSLWLSTIFRVQLWKYCIFQ